MPALMPDHFTMKIAQVSMAGCAQFTDVETAVQTLQRVIGPGDQIQTQFQREFSLGQLEPITNALIPDIRAERRPLPNTI